jgi:thiamine-monophosphate kinase
VKISALGEDRLIARISKQLPAGNFVRRGIGDDCAVFRIDARRDGLLASDMLVEGVHFSARTPAEQVGWKLLAVNLSDIAAMGGTPRAAVVSLGLPRSTPVAWVEKLYRGLGRCARRYGVSIVGGDTVRAPKRVADLAILGEVPAGKAVLRSGAQPGDFILVTGRLGGSFKSGRHLSFTPRLKEAAELVRQGKPTAMMDLSDGLWIDLPRLCKASGVCAEIETASVPRNKNCSISEALTDGEDFELMLTVRPKNLNGLLRRGLTPIGKILPSKKGTPAVRWLGLKSSPKGFRHF